MNTTEMIWQEPHHFIQQQQSLEPLCVISAAVTASEGFPGGSDSKESACNAGDLGSTPGSGRSLGRGRSNPLQCSCPENPMDRGAWRAVVHGVTKGRTRPSDQTPAVRPLVGGLVRGGICRSPVGAAGKTACTITGGSPFL